MTKYNGLSKQRKEILDVINNLEKATYNDVKNTLENVGNVHEQMARLLNDDFIKRISDNEFALTEKGKTLYDKKRKKKESIRFSEDEVKEFNNFARDKNFYKNFNDVCLPKLYGLEKEKLGCVLSLISLPDVEGDRNRINVLLEGQPGSGKTKLIEGITQEFWGLFGDSIRLSKSSLAGSAKGGQFKPGLVQQADTSLIALDEIDKLNGKDQQALLGAMSRGKVTINLDQVNRETDARVRVVATCNRGGALLQELRSRFDLQFYVKKLTKEEQHMMIKIMVENWGRKKNIFNEDMLKRYLQYCNTFETSLPEDREWLTEFMIEENTFGLLQKKDNRNKETILRLSLAIARLRLSKEVLKEHVKKAIELVS